MKAVLKSQLYLFLAAMAGITISTVFTRGDHHRSLMDWPTARGIVVGTSIAYALFCTCLWIWRRPQGSVPVSK
jgi:hypothetical protein